MKIMPPLKHVMLVLVLFFAASLPTIYAEDALHRPGHGDAKLAAWSPDGEWIAVVSDDALSIYTPEFENVATFTLDAPITSLVWNPGSQQLATTSHARSIQLWEIPSGTMHALYIARVTNDRYTGSVSYSPDGSYLASAHPDNAVRIWDVAERTLIKTITLEAPATAVAWHPDGEWIAVGTSVMIELEDDNEVVASSIQIRDIASATIVKRLDSDRFILPQDYEEITLLPDFVPVGYLHWYADGTKLLMQTYDIYNERGWEIAADADTLPEPMNIIAECGTGYKMPRIAPDGLRVAIGEGHVGCSGNGEGGLSSWDIEITEQVGVNEALRGKLLLNTSDIRDITWHPNSETLAVVTGEGTVLIATFDPNHEDFDYSFEPELILDP